MEGLSERIASLSPEKRLLLELLQKQKDGAASQRRALATGNGTAAEAAKTRAFSLVSEAERAKLPKGLEDAYPLTMLQAGMIYHMEQTPDYPIFHNVDSYSLVSPLDAEVLTVAINSVIARHPILRTSFDLTSYSEPLQLVHSFATMSVPLFDVRNLSADEQNAVINEHIDKEKRLRFDIARPPLIRFSIHRRTEESYQLTITEFHPILDGWSLNSTIAEIFKLYFVLLNNETIETEPPLSVTFRDYVQMERQALQSQEFKQYWTEKLNDCSIIHLPRWSASHRASEVVPIRATSAFLGSQVVNALNEIARANQVPIKSILLATHLKVLSELSGHGDILTGMSIQGRPEGIDGDKVRGLFLNMVPFRQKLSGGTWIDLIKEVFRNESDMMPYRRYPLAAIQKDLGAASLFETAFNVVRFHVYLDLIDEGRPIDLGGEGRELEENNFTLMTNFSFAPNGDELLLVLEYETSEIAHEQARRILGYYKKAIDCIINDPLAQYQTISLLSKEERDQILVDWNNTKEEWPESQGVFGLFAEQAEMYSDRIAVRMGEEQISYQELMSRSARVADELIRHGVGPEEVVGLLCRRSIEMVVGLLGIMQAGGAYLPLEVSQPEARLEYMVKQSGARMVLSGERERKQAEGLSGEVVVIGEISNRTVEANQRAVTVDGSNLVYVIYTSGTTGEPKGVMVTQCGVENYLRWAREAYKGEGCETGVVHTPLSFDLTVTSLLVPLVSGSRVELAEEGVGVEGLVKVLRERVSGGLLKVTPTHLEGLREVLSEEERRRSGTVMVVGGEALRRELAEEWSEKGRRVINEYGPTETVVGCSVEEVKRGEEGEVLIGRPIANMRMYVKGEKEGLVGVGVAGEIYIGGAGVARGYIGRGDITAERFVPDGESERGGERVYRSGDIGRVEADGRIRYEGRRDGQVKVRGYRIELGEIEEELRKERGVKGAVVVVKEGERGEKRLVGYVEAAEREWEEEETKTRLRKRLPEYMVPVRIERMDRLPVTINGKIDRKALAAMEGKGKAKEGAYEEPSNETERRLAAIWEQVLDVKQVGRHDNFFSLGGDSILILPIVAKATKAGIKIIPRQIFQYPTVAGLSSVARIDVATQKAPVPTQKIKRSEVPLTPIQKWFFEQGHGDINHFNQAVMLAVTDDLDVDLLERVIEKLQTHHDALRMKYQREGGQWKQWQEAEPAKGVVRRIDVRGKSIEEERKAIEAAATDIQRSLNLERGEVMRVGVMELGEGRGKRVMIAIHHLVIDGVSWRILLEDMQSGYETAKAGKEIEFGPKTTSFKTWAENMTAIANSEQMAREIDYWIEQVNSEAGEIPKDHSQVTRKMSSARVVRVKLDKDETKELIRQAASVYHAKTEEVMIAALVNAIGRWANCDHVLLELEGHGRDGVGDAVDVTRTVGWFTSMYPVALNSRRNAPIEVALRDIKEQLRAVPRGGIGYGALRYLCKDSSVRHRLTMHREPEISFNYLGQFEGTGKGDLKMDVATESLGEGRSRDDVMRHAIELTIAANHGELEFEWLYSGDEFQRDTIEHLANDQISELRAFLVHCRTVKTSHYSPSDFPLANLSQESLDQITSSAQVEDIYRLSPIQEGLLFHTLQSSGSGVYIQQLSCLFDGKLDLAAFKNAWHEVVNRHPVLKTAFLWQGVAEPVQVVHRKIDLQWEDQHWGNLGATELMSKLDEYLKQDRLRGLDLEHPPMMRLALMDCGDAGFQFIWTFHHLLLDAWAQTTIVDEALMLYQGYRNNIKVELSPAAPFKEYINWLDRQDLGKAESFWKRTLQGFIEPTPIFEKRNLQLADRTDEDYGHQVSVLSQQTSKSLQDVAKRMQLTLNTLIQGVWAIVLAKQSARDDVVFGIVVSGRPVDLPNASGIVGVFINTLPVRIRIEPKRPLALWLKAIQDQVAEIREYEFSPLVQIQQWSEVPHGRPLFDSYLNFLNVPKGQSAIQGDDTLTIHSSHSVERASYPIAVDVVPGDPLSFEITYDRRYFSEATIAHMSESFLLALDQMVARSDASVGLILDALDELAFRKKSEAENEYRDLGRQGISRVKRKLVGE